jgi:CDGSH-type Zn-finger protein
MKIEVMENGPYVIRGKSSVTDKDGKTTDHANDIYLCRCGKSINKPYCDGSHHNMVFDK